MTANYFQAACLKQIWVDFTGLILQFFFSKYMTCSCCQKNETTNSPIHEFKVPQNVFLTSRMKKQGLNVF
jgi:hypothetical protein